MAADPDKPCAHRTFAANVAVGRLYKADEHDGPPDAYIAEVTVQCEDCGEPFRWIGVPAGLRHDRPMVSIDEKTLHAPLRPASSDPDFGLSGIPGFAVRWVDA